LHYLETGKQVDLVLILPSTLELAAGVGREKRGKVHHHENLLEGTGQNATAMLSNNRLRAFPGLEPFLSDRLRQRANVVTVSNSLQMFQRAKEDTHAPCSVNPARRFTDSQGFEHRRNRR
jgi:hypothetical protein